jgi:hypothetical protein
VSLLIVLFIDQQRVDMAHIASDFETAVDARLDADRIECGARSLVPHDAHFVPWARESCGAS